MDSARLRASTAILLLGGSLFTFISALISGTLPLIGAAFGANNAQLGPMVGALVAGFAIFQIPAGLIALRIGARHVLLIGIFLAGFATLFSGFSSNLLELGILRFLAGVGWALGSGTAFSLLSKYYPEGQRGKWFGVFYGVTNGLGGLVGVPLSTALGLFYGWVTPFKLLGAITTIVAILMFFVLPVQEGKKLQEAHTTQIWTHASEILRSRSVWGLAIGLMGLGAAGYAGADYLLQYFNQVHPTWGISLAADIVAIATGFTFPGGLIGGRIGDKHLDKRFFLMIFVAIIGVAYFSLSFLSWEAILGVYIIAGTVYGAAITIMYLIPSHLPESRGEGLTLSIGIINTTQYGFASFFLAIFGVFSVSEGYTFAWILTGVVTIVLLPFLFFVKKNSKDRAASELIQATPSR